MGLYQRHLACNTNEIGIQWLNNQLRLCIRFWHTKSPHSILWWNESKTTKLLFLQQIFFLLSITGCWLVWLNLNYALRLSKTGGNTIIQGLGHILTATSVSLSTKLAYLLVLVVSMRGTCWRLLCLEEIPGGWAGIRHFTGKTSVNTPQWLTHTPSDRSRREKYETFEENIHMICMCIVWGEDERPRLWKGVGREVTPGISSMHWKFLWGTCENAKTEHMQSRDYISHGRSPTRMTQQRGHWKVRGPGEVFWGKQNKCRFYTPWLNDALTGGVKQGPVRGVIWVN